MPKKKKLQPLYVLTEEDEEDEEEQKKEHPIIKGLTGAFLGIVTGLSILAGIILLLTYEGN